MNRKSTFWIDDKIWENKINKQFSCKLFKYPWIARYVIDYYRDSILPSLVFLYHKNKYKNNFLSFIIKENYIKIIHPQIIQLLSNHFNTIENIVNIIEKNFDDVKNIDIVWDIHGVCKTKLLITKNNRQKFIITWKDFFSDNIVIKIFKEIFNQKSFYHYKKSWDFYIRKFIPYQNNFIKRKDIELFYDRLWEILWFFYWIRTIDLHYENMLIYNNTPYIFDFECVFCPELIEEDFSFSTAWILQSNNWEDFSIFSWGRENRKSLLTPILTSIDRNPKLIRTTKSKRKMLHIPMSENKVIKPYIFYETFFKSLNKSLEEVFKNKEKIINAISNNITYNRILMRPTRVYYALIKDLIMNFSTNNDNINISNFFKDKLNILPIIPNVFDKEKIIESEIMNLMNWNIPSFYTEIHRKEIFDIGWNNVWTLHNTCISTTIKHLNNIKSYNTTL